MQSFFPGVNASNSVGVLLSLDDGTDWSSIDLVAPGTAFNMGDQLTINSTSFTVFGRNTATALRSVPGNVSNFSFTGGMSGNDQFAILLFPNAAQADSVSAGTSLSLWRGADWLLPATDGAGSTFNFAATGGAFTTVPNTATPVLSFTVSAPSGGGSFTARAPGGVRFITTSQANITTNTNPPLGVYLAPGESSWRTLSDRNAKTKSSPVDHREVLRKVARMPVTSWEYKHDPGRQFIGPMAQDFRAAFGLGHDDKHISTLDTDGVALSALQGLIAELQVRKDRSAAQAARLRELETELQSLRRRLAAE